MTVSSEKTGKTTLTGATDAEGDPIVMFRAGTTLPGGGTGGTTTFPATVTLANPTSAITTVSVSIAGVVPLDDGGNPVTLPALGATGVVLGTFQYTIADDNGAESTVGGLASNGVYTATITANGVASVNPNAYVTAGLVADWNANSGVSNTAGTVTAWLDTVSSRALTIVGAPTVGVITGGTATATVVVPANGGFTCADLTGFPTGASPRTVSALWKFDGTVLNFAGAIGYGANVTDQAFTIDIDTAGNLEADYFTNKTLFGLVPTNLYAIVTLTYDGTNVVGYVGAAKAFTVAKALNTGATLINIMRSFSAKTTTGTLCRMRVYGRVLTAAEIAQDVAAYKAEWIGSGNPSNPSAPTGTNIVTDGFTASGTTAVSYGVRAWAVRTSSTTMTEAEIIAGTGALAFGVSVQNNSTAWSPIITGGSPATGYYVNVIDYDLTGGKTAVVKSAVITTASAALPAAVLTLGSGGTPTTSGTTLSFTSDRVGTYDVVVYDPAAQADPDFATAETWAGAGVSPASPAVIPPTNDASGLASSNSVAVSGLLSSKAYKAAIAYRNSEGTASPILYITFTTANATVPGTVRDTLLGLKTQVTPNGRMLVTSPKTIATDGIPSGWNLSGQTLLATQSNAVIDDYLLSDIRIDTNGFSGGSVTNVRHVLTGTAFNGVYPVYVSATSHNWEFSDYSGEGNYGRSDESAWVFQAYSGTGTGTTTSRRLWFKRCRIKWFQNDIFKATGGGPNAGEELLIQQCYLGFPAQTDTDVTVYDGTPSHYSNGNWVRYGTHNYVSQCIAAGTATIAPTSNGNAEWSAASAGPHSDWLNNLGNTGVGTICEDTFFDTDTNSAEAARTANINQTLRPIRNTGADLLFNRLILRRIFDSRNHSGAAIPFLTGAGTGANYNGPIDVSDSFLGANFGGTIYSGPSALIGAWSNNVDAQTGAAIPQP